MSGMTTTAILSASLTRFSILESSSCKVSVNGDTTFVLRLYLAVSLGTLCYFTPFLLYSWQKPVRKSTQIVRVCVEHDEDERNDEVEEEPSIDHLDV